jgi:transcriptional regulator with XRE-family HTH domain
MELDLIGLGKRLGEYIDYKNISMNKLGKLIGTSSGQISIIISGKKFGTDKLLNIIAALPELNPDWLLTGQGHMEKSGAKRGISLSGTNNIIGNRNKQKNISGVHGMEELAVPYGRNNQSDTSQELTDLQQQLRKCQEEKDALNRELVDTQKEMIEILKGKK